jgi:hypothetical protein
VGVVQHVQACVQDLLQIVGADKLLKGDTLPAIPPEQQEQQQQSVADVTAAAAAAMAEVMQQVPAVVQQHVQQLLVFDCSAAGDGWQQQQQQQLSGSDTGSSCAGPAPGCAGGHSVTGAPTYLLSWGMWCILQLLVLSQVGSQHLQGRLRGLALHCLQHWCCKAVSGCPAAVMRCLF